MSSTIPPPPELRRLRVAGAVFGLVLVAGIVGYVVIADMSVVDAVYMAVITVSTVGYGEVVPLDAGGKLLTVLLIAGGVGSASYGAVTAAEFVVEGHLGHYIERRRMGQRIEHLSGHVVVCGYGRVGRHLIARLVADGVPFVIVEADEARADEAESVGPVVRGDASEESTLTRAGIELADRLVACVNSDADNVLVTLTARGMRPDMQVVARAKSDENERKLMRAGADHVILPASIGGRRIAALLTRPTVVDFLDALGDDGMDYQLDEVRIREEDGLAGLTLEEADLRGRHGVSVLGVRQPGGELDQNPRPRDVLHPGAVLVVMGSEEGVAELRARR